MYPLSWPALIPLCFGYGLALIHGSLGLSSLPTFGALICAALLLAVYGGYYLATLLSCRRMALSAAHRQRQE